MRGVGQGSPEEQSQRDLHMYVKYSGMYGDIYIYVYREREMGMDRLGDRGRDGAEERERQR